MSLPKFSVNQSLFVNLISFMIIIVGLIVVFGLNREVFPNVTFDIVSVATSYPGATPQDVEKLITIPIEKELKEVDGIKEINSTSAASAWRSMLSLGRSCSVIRTDKSSMTENQMKSVDKQLVM